MTPTPISVITPSLNQRPFLDRTVRSVLGQGVAELECHVIDGGSTDGSVELLRSYGSVLQWISEPDRGQAQAMNKGLASSTGPIIGLLNSDDVYNSGALPAVLDFFSAHPQVDVVYGDANIIDEHDQHLGRYPTQPWSIDALKVHCFLCQPAVFFRRRVFETYGLIDESLNYCMDYEYWLRLALAGATFAYLPRMLASLRMHAASKSCAAPLAHSREVLGVLRRHLGHAAPQHLRHHCRLLVDHAGLLSRDHPRLNRSLREALSYVRCLPGHWTELRLLAIHDGRRLAHRRQRGFDSIGT